MSSLVVGVGECTISRIIKAAKLSPAYDLLAGVSGNWTKVANGLNTSLVEKNKIKSAILLDKLSDVDDILELLLTDWIGKTSGNAKLETLTAVFEENGMNDLATKIKAEFNATSATSRPASSSPSATACSVSSISNVELVTKMKQRITANLKDLIESTYLSAIVMAHLQSNGVLSKAEGKELNSIPNPDTKNARFYELLEAKLGPDRPSAYLSLLEVMEKEQQTGVCSYLKLE